MLSLPETSSALVDCTYEPWRLVCEPMTTVFFSLFLSFRSSFRIRAALQAEILALRHHLSVLQRANQHHRLELNAADRVLWVWLSRLWSGWRSALLIVKPETVIAWHRTGFRLYWTLKSRVRNGRPPVSRETRDLIREMSLANPRWGAPGSTASCSNWELRFPKPPWPNTWSIIEDRRPRLGRPS